MQTLSALGVSLLLALLPCTALAQLAQSCPSPCPANGVCTFTPTPVFVHVIVPLRDRCPAGTVDTGQTRVTPKTGGPGRVCQQPCSKATLTACKPGFWGPRCEQSCPRDALGKVCDDHGACSEGPTGQGMCRCQRGFTGALCQYSDATTCNGHGKVDWNGVCLCEARTWGPTCHPCPADANGQLCGGHGTCDAGIVGSGKCVCQAGYSGPLCAPRR